MCCSLCCGVPPRARIEREFRRRQVSEPVTRSFLSEAQRPQRPQHARIYRAFSLRIGCVLRLTWPRRSGPHRALGLPVPTLNCPAVIKRRAAGP